MDMARYPRINDESHSNIFLGEYLLQLLIDSCHHGSMFSGLSGQDCLNYVDSFNDKIKASKLYPGERVVFRLSNNPINVIWLLCLLANKNIPVILPAEATEIEMQRVYSQAGCTRKLDVCANKAVYTIVGDTSTALSEYEPGIILPSSGSEGLPKLVFRNNQSLLAEAGRYVNGLNLSRKDVIAIPVPISHAYALGWLISAIMAGASLTLIKSTEFSAIESVMANNATIVVLIPTLARLLAKRKPSEKIRPSRILRFVMVGAGGVDDQLNNSFFDKFDIELSRNYGSTETGATFFGIGQLPAFCIGTPFPGINYRIINNDNNICSVNEIGLLEIKEESSMLWRDTGDLAFCDEHNRIYIAGRKNKCIRYGDRWISTLEIETILRGYQGIKDLHVYGDNRTDNGSIIADVVTNESYNEPEFWMFCNTNLSSYKIPNRINIVTNLNRNEVGKIRHIKQYKITNQNKILEYVQYYKVSELLFALLELGVLDELKNSVDVVSISQKYQLNEDVLQNLFELCEKLDIISSTSEDDNPDIFDILQFVRYENNFSTMFTNRHTIRQAVEDGIKNIPLSQVPDDIKQKYQNVLHGRSSKFRALSALRALKSYQFNKIIEFTGGASNYLEYIPCGSNCKAYLSFIGRFSKNFSNTISDAIQCNQISLNYDSEDDFDLCIFNNAIHYLDTKTISNFITTRMRTNAIIVIDDIFLPDRGIHNLIFLDWLTHGGINFRSKAELLLLLESLKLKVFKVTNESINALNHVIIYQK